MIFPKKDLSGEQGSGPNEILHLLYCMGCLTALLTGLIQIPSSFQHLPVDTAVDTVFGSSRTRFLLQGNHGKSKMMVITPIVM